MSRSPIYTINGQVWRFDARRLEALYLRARLKQEFADAMSVSRQSLHQWFAGAVPSQDMARLIKRHHPEAFILIGDA